MFSKEITGLTLTNGIASTLFSNITGDTFRGDESFVATMRALLSSRVSKEESIRLRYHYTSYEAGQLRGAQPRDCIRAFLRSTPITEGYRGVLYIHSFDGDTDGNTACFEALDAGYAKVLAGYTPMEDLSKWFETNGKIRARFYVNAELQNTVIFVEKLNMKRWHLLESMIPRYFPWYFEGVSLEEEEIAILRSLTKRYAPEYEEKIEQFSKRFDFRSQIIRDRLTGFETKFDRRKLRDVRDQMSSVEHSLQDLENRFASFYQQMNELKTQELGLIEKINGGGGEESSELLDYFLLNKSLHLMEVSNGRIEFVVTTTLANFDPDAAESILNNNRSYFYTNTDTGRDFENRDMTRRRIKRLLTEVFLKETMKIRLCAAYRLNFDDGRYNAMSGYTFPRDIASEYTPNQHIQAFHCLGGNEPIIRGAMRKRDYVGAVEACVASAKSVNLMESVTCVKMMDALFSNSIGKVIEMPDGSLKTPLDAVKWLEEQDEKKEKEQKQKEEGHE